ncbi:MAG: heme-binding protein [Prolixibacteraceae bacterium]|jgi:uncharacterized protein GlcG (DUF336 family)|nr:heme-binding protein [Prolixibacteraceae bacterium]
MKINSLDIIDWVNNNIHRYLSNTDDFNISDGNVALCIIEPDGTVNGKMFGSDESRKQVSFNYAWRKAFQVRVTGIKTGEFEEMVFSNKIDEYAYAINRPDYIGWLGGQPIPIDKNKFLAIGFSGFRGETDLQIIADAITSLNAKSNTL